MDWIIFQPHTHLNKNEVIEHKNRSLEEMARTMLLESSLPKNFWAETVNTSA